MARVTVEEVKLILEDCQLTDSQVEAFISGATEMVTEALGEDSSLSSDLKKEIERWLTAHMISISVERMAEEEGAGGAKIKYTGSFSEGLRSSPYGQMVLELDTTGKMASLGMKKADIIAVESF